MIHDICWIGARSKWTRLLTCAVLINLAGCGAVSALQDQEPKPDLSRLRQAAADLEGSVAVGVSYVDFGHKLQNLSSAVVLARQDGVKPDRLRPYEQAIEGYMDSLNLWKLKLQCPSAFGDGYPECSATLEVEALAAKYGVPFDRHAPLGPENEKYLKGLAAMDTYSPRLTTSQVRQAHEQKYNYLLTLYQGQQATRAVYNKLLATIWEKSAKTAQESTPMKSAKRD